MEEEPLSWVNNQEIIKILNKVYLKVDKEAHRDNVDGEYQENNNWFSDVERLMAQQCKKTTRQVKSANKN